MAGLPTARALLAAPGSPQALMMIAAIGNELRELEGRPAAAWRDTMLEAGAICAALRAQPAHAAVQAMGLGVLGICASLNRASRVAVHAADGVGVALTALRTHLSTPSVAEGALFVMFTMVQHVPVLAAEAAS